MGNLTLTAQSELIGVIEREVPVLDKEIALILAAFTPRTFLRNEMLLHSGNIAQEVFFVLNGALRQFYPDEDGNERTCNFTFEKDFVTDLESFSQQTASSSAIKALTTTECLCLRHDDLQKLLRESPAIAAFFRIVVERTASKSIRRTKSLLSHSPEKQLNELAAEQPEIFQRVPQRYIAQYLGIAPESLSRVRKRMITNSKS